MIKNIITSINKKKDAEFNQILGVYFIPEDFDTDSKYEVYQNMYQESDYIDTSDSLHPITKSVFSIAFKCVINEFTSRLLSTKILSKSTTEFLSNEVSDILKR